MGALRSIFIGLGITVLATILLTMLLSTTLLVAAAPIVAQEYPTPLLDESRACASGCFELAQSRGFTVPDHANRLEGYFSVAMMPTSGPVRIAVYDSAGRSVFQHTFASGSGSEQQSATWSATPGTWTMSVSFAGFMGSFDAGILARGLNG